MSNPISDNEPSDNTVLVSALGWIGVFLVFLLIVAVAYLPNRAVSQTEKDAAERMSIRKTVEAEQSRLVASYEWVNQAEGVVRLPVERAMELTVEEIRSEKSR